MFSREDLAKFKAFKGVMNQAKFDIQGNAVLAAASLFAWFHDLEKKIEASIPQPPVSGKEIKEPIATLGEKPISKKRGRKPKVKTDGV